MSKSTQHGHFSVFPAKASPTIPTIPTSTTPARDRLQKHLTIIDNSYDSAAPGATSYVPAPVSMPGTTQSIPLQSTRPAVIEHPYAPTAPGATGRYSTSTTIPLTTLDTSNDRLTPVGSLDYDLRIRTNDPTMWAQWASDLHREVLSLRHIQDLGPYTMGIIAMMKEDGLWPIDDSVDLKEEEEEGDEEEDEDEVKEEEGLKKEK